MNYELLKNLITTNLNDNDNGIIFDVDVFNSPNHDYEIEVNRTDGYGVDVKRVVPTMISAPFGDNIPVPNTFGVDGSMELQFDLFIGDETKFIDKYEEDKFASANYLKTIDTIQDFIVKMLSKVRPLGRSAIFFGGEDSILTATDDATPYNNLYIEFNAIDNFEESILKTDTIELVKLQNGTIRFLLGGVTRNTTVQYSVGENTKLLVWTDDGTNWYLNDDTTNYHATGGTRITENITLGYGGGLNAKVYDVRLGSNGLTYDQVTLIDNYEWTVLYADFDDIDNIENIGSGVETGKVFTPTVENCILWGEDGNIVLGFTTLIPVEAPTVDKGYKYQRFSLSVPFLYTKDIVFGNHFRYFLNIDTDNDGLFNDSEDFEVFAIDRQHTYGSELTSRQNIVDNFGKSITNESMKDLSKTFLYKPNRNMTRLLKKIMTGTIEQNQRYRIKVQAPFFTTYYECIVESGGNGTELYTFSTFTLQFKEVIDFD